MKKIKADKKTAENINADKITAKNKKTVTKSDTEIKERNKQTVIVITAEAVIKAATMTMTKINIKIKKVTNFKFKKNIRLLAAIQIMLKILFIFLNKLALLSCWLKQH